MTDRQRRAIAATDLITKLDMPQPYSQIADIVLAAMAYETEQCAKIADCAHEESLAGAQAADPECMAAADTAEAIAKTIRDRNER